MLSKLNKLNPLRYLRKHRDGGISSKEAFTAILKRERARADRNAHCFSLTVFNVSKEGSEKTLDRFSDLLTERIRSTDVSGWLTDSHIGVLLPETPAAGAWILARHVCKVMEEESRSVKCDVFTYPSTMTSRFSDYNPRQMWFEDLANHQAEPPSFLEGFSKSKIPDDLTRSSNGEKPHIPETTPMTGLDLMSYLGEAPPPWKRGLDILGAPVLVLLFSPIMVGISLLIKCTSRGPVFFKQQRVGFMGNPFTCFKFRTMHLDADETVHKDHISTLIQSDTPMTKLDTRKDGRIIPLGGLLRKSGLDELPQLFNVIRGEMSIVGPRPCIPYEYEEYDGWHRRRVDVIPGLTGLWQVKGKNRTTFNQMMRMDLAYSQRLTLWLDLSILFKTLPAIAGQMFLKPSYQKPTEVNPEESTC